MLPITSSKELMIANPRRSISLRDVICTLISYQLRKWNKSISVEDRMVTKKVSNQDIHGILIYETKRSEGQNNVKTSHLIVDHLEAIIMRQG